MADFAVFTPKILKIPVIWNHDLQTNCADCEVSQYPHTQIWANNYIIIP